MILQTPCLRRGIVTLVAFVLLFSTVRFQMFLQTPYLRRGIVALVALDLSLLCIFCVLSQMAIIRVSIVTLVAFVLLFSTVRFPRLPQMAFIMMQSRIGCTCLTFLHCAFSNDPSNSVPEKWYSHTGCICFTFLHIAFYMLPQMIFTRGRICCICLTFLHCTSSNVSSNGLPEKGG